MVALANALVMVFRYLRSLALAECSLAAWLVPGWPLWAGTGTAGAKRLVLLTPHTGAGAAEVRRAAGACAGYCSGACND